MSIPALEHPANLGFCRFREPWRPGPNVEPPARPDDVARPYDSLGTHPDLVARLWDELGANLPVDCRYVFCGAPVLMHPTTQVVFAFAGGTHTLALRLPEREFAAAIEAGATRVKVYPGRQPSIDLAKIGPEWVFVEWLKGEQQWCLAAYELAGRGTQ